MNREKAMQWWNELSSLRKTQLCDTNTEIVGKTRRQETLTGREIEKIYEIEHKPKPIDYFAIASMTDEQLNNHLKNITS